MVQHFRKKTQKKPEKKIAHVEWRNSAESELNFQTNEH